MSNVKKNVNLKTLNRGGINFESITHFQDKPI